MKTRVRVLFLCTANCFRSPMAEVLLRHRGGDRFESLSAGAHPAGYVHPIALATLEQLGLDTTVLRSKSWDEFAEQQLDLVITLCDAAAQESCPVWLGSPPQVHWPLPDPAGVLGSDEEVLQFSLLVAGRLDGMIQQLVEMDWSGMSPAQRSGFLERVGCP